MNSVQWKINELLVLLIMRNGGEIVLTAEELAKPHRNYGAIWINLDPVTGNMHLRLNVPRKNDVKLVSLDEAEK